MCAIFFGSPFRPLVLGCHTSFLYLPPPLSETGGRRSGGFRVSTPAIVMGAKLLLRPCLPILGVLYFGPSNTCRHSLQKFGEFKSYKLLELPVVNPLHLLCRNFCAEKKHCRGCFGGKNIARVSMD